MDLIQSLVIFLLFNSILALEAYNDDIADHLKCVGKMYKNVSLTAYYPIFEENEEEKGFLDIEGKKLKTLQDYLDDRVPYVTLAMDEDLHLDYGISVCCPELNRHFGRYITLNVRDTGSNLKGQGYKRADICVRTETDSYDNSVNRLVTLVF